MITALKQTNSLPNNTPIQIEIANEVHQKELEETKQRHSEVIASFERQLADIKGRYEETEGQMKLLMKKQAGMEELAEQKESEYQACRKEFDVKYNKLVEEYKNIKEASQLDLQFKMEKSNRELERLKLEHEKEIAAVKQKCEQSLNDIKYIHDQERMRAENKLEKIREELKLAQSYKEVNNSANFREIQSNCLEEIQELNAHLDIFKKQSYEQMAQLKSERDDAIKKCEGCERAIEKLINEKSKIVSQNIQPTAEVAKKPQINNKKGLESSLRDLNKLKKENVDLKSYIAKLEINEKKLKALITQKDALLSIEKEKSKKALEEERKKAIEAYEECNKIKEEFMGNKYDSLDRSNLLEKLQKNEDILKEMGHKMDELQKQKDEALSELNMVNLELQKTKSQQSMAEKKNAQNVSILKSDIKLIISKLVHSKEKITEAVPDFSPLKKNSKPRCKRSISTINGNEIKSSRLSSHRQTNGTETFSIGRPIKEKQKDMPRMMRSLSTFFPNELKENAHFSAKCGMPEEMNETKNEENSQSKTINKLPEFHKKALKDLNTELKNFN